MNIIRKKPWAIAESQATPEHVFLNRRHFMSGATALGAYSLFGAARTSASAQDPSVGLYPVSQNPAYSLDRPLTAEKHAANYNNFYEFGQTKSIASAARKLEIRPWTVEIDGLVNNPQVLDIDDLLTKMSLEERLYRHRCVERWAMAVPWSGFPLADLVKLADPLSDANYVRFETFLDPDTAPGQRQSWYPWPYVEGLTLAEATNELSFMVTGIYGKPLANQFGAPLRLALPWKYGFKSIKSIVKISFVKERPTGLWEAIQPSEYGFWANVNPEVPHPRWSQAEEQMLGGDILPTQLYNGYAEQVASLYQGMTDEKLFM